jgi:hypothetical protein
VVRAWLKPDVYHDEVTGSYDFTSVYDHFTQITGYSDQLFVNVEQCDRSLMDLNSPQKCRAVLKAGIKHYKQRYPSLRYIEVFNEPDKNWAVRPDEKPALSVEEYYQWYRIAYSVVNEVNSELDPQVRLAVGGPVTYQFNETYLKAFLDRFAADTNTAKRLDFISYHDYGRRANPATVQAAKATIQDWLVARGLNRATPVVVSEYGVFPGGPETTSGQGTTFSDDLLTQAAAMATLGNFYVRGSTDMPMHWVLNHPTNERKSMFVDEVDGAVHPYYNVVRMQRMLKRTRVKAESTAVSPAGIGINALATRDDTGVAVLATNYQWTTGTTAYEATVDIRNLGARFSGMSVLVERYLVDARTSNYAHDPAKSGLQRVQRYTLPAGSTPSISFPLAPNAVSLLVLTPVVHVEAEHAPTVVSAGDTAVDIADSAAGGGQLNKLTANGVGDFVRYTVELPQAGRYRIVGRLKRTPERGTVQLSVDGVAQGAVVDTRSTGFNFVDVEFGARTFNTTAPKSFTFTVVGTSGGAYTVGVDRLQLIRLENPAT